MRRKKSITSLLALVLVAVLISSIFFGPLSIFHDDDEDNVSEVVAVDAGSCYYFHTQGEDIETMPESETPLPEEAEKALKRVPGWLRDDLEKKFGELSAMPIDVTSHAAPYFYDFEDDGDMDLVLGSLGGTLSFKENMGTAFARKLKEDPRLFGAIASTSHSSPAFLDYEGDGDTDLVLGCGDGTVGYYENTGSNKNPKWKENSHVFSSINVGRNAHPVFADMDDDGDLDLTIGAVDDSTYDADIYYYENTGSNTNPVWERNDFMYVSLLSYEIEQHPYPALSDLDDDGDVDLTLGGQNGQLRYFENQFSAGVTVWREIFSIYADIDVGEHATPSFADLNGDSCYDLVVGTWNGTLFHFENKGTPESPRFVGLSSGEIYYSGSVGEVVGGGIHEARKIFLGPGTINIDRTLQEEVEDDVETYAGLILESPGYCVDELAFIIAHTSTPVLRAMSGTIDLNDPECDYGAEILLEHVKEHYQLKGKLGYADIVEKKDYTTIRYTNGEGEEKELPRDVYYWYVIHPRCRYEAPGYTHDDFWREYLRNDDQYGMSLVDAVKDAENMHQAVYQLTDWFAEFMDFGYESTDKTPIEIYDLHYGSCGEHSVLTNALGRAVFIPTRLANNWGEDHVWNEFYDEVTNGSWHHWDTTGPSIDDPERYERGGKDMSTVWSQRGDDYVYGITEKYTPTSRVTIKVVDRNGHPVDGACVVMESEYFVRHNPLYWPVPTISLWNYTDTDGKCVFELGENYYTIDVMSQIGNYHRGYPDMNEYSPTGSYHVEEGRVEELTCVIDGRMPEDSRGDSSGTRDGDYFEIDFRVRHGEVHAQSIVTYPDDTVVIEGNPYPVVVEGTIDFFVCDEENFHLYLQGYDFDCFWKMNNARNGHVKIPKGDWYIVFSNDDTLNTAKYVEVDVVGGG